MSRPSHDEEREAIEGHVDVVKLFTGNEEWPDDGPHVPGNGPEALAAWAYVTGYANALGMTARELLDSLEIAW